MTFKPGQSGNPAGRPKGAVNKVTRTVREAFEEAFAKLQEDPDKPYALVPWGMKNPDKFYMLSQKLIPSQVAATVDDATSNLTPEERSAKLAAIVLRLEEQRAEQEEAKRFDLA